MDFSKIKQSKYFQALQGSNRTVVNELVTDIHRKTLLIYFSWTIENFVIRLFTSECFECSSYYVFSGFAGEGG